MSNENPNPEDQPGGSGSNRQSIMDPANLQLILEIVERLIQLDSQQGTSSKFPSGAQNDRKSKTIPPKPKFNMRRVIAHRRLFQLESQKLDGIIEKLKTPRQNRVIDIDDITAKVKEFTKEDEKCYEQIANSINRDHNQFLKSMTIGHRTPFKRMTESRQNTYIRLLNWLELFDEEEKKEVLKLNENLVDKWYKMWKDEKKREYEEMKKEEDISVTRIIRRLRTPLGDLIIDPNDVIRRVNAFFDEDDDRICATIGQSYRIFKREMMNPRPKRYEEMSERMQEMYLRLFNWLDFYKSDEKKEKVLVMYQPIWRKWNELKEKEKEEERNQLFKRLLTI